MNLIQLLKIDSDIDWWQNEQDSIFQHTSTIDDTLSLIKDEKLNEIPLDENSWKNWNYTPSNKILNNFKNKQIIFIDGKINILLNLLTRSHTILMAQSSANYITYYNKKLKINEKPEIENYIIIPENLYYNIEIKQPLTIKIKNYNINFIIEKLPYTTNNYQYLLQLMRSLEYKLALTLLKNKDAIIIKDGVLYSEYPVIKSNNLIIGYVKRIIKEKLNFNLLKYALNMKRKQRTPFFASKINNESKKIRISSYVKLIDTNKKDPDYMGLVRIEAFIKTDKFNKQLITDIFDYLTLLLPDLTCKGPLPRLPENILPIYTLEKYMSNFFIDSNLFKSIITKWKNI